MWKAHVGDTRRQARDGKMSRWAFLINGEPWSFEEEEEEDAQTSAAKNREIALGDRDLL